jgi:hypothetical protein
VDLKQWLDQFKRLHAKARKGELSQNEQAIYFDRREELARALVTAQSLTLLPGQTPRQAVRIARMLQIDLELAKGRVRAMTQNLSTGGFATLLGELPGTAEVVGFSLKVPGADVPIIGRCTVREVQKRSSNNLTSFAFVDLPHEQHERLEMMIFDAVIDQFDSVSQKKS